MITTRARDLSNGIAAARVARLQADADQLRLVTELALEYRVEEDDVLEIAAGERLIQRGAEGTPLISEFLALELAALLHRSVRWAAMYLAEALNLRWRHPSLWAQVQALTLESSRALRAAGRCGSLRAELADEVGQRWVTRQAGLGWEAAFTLLDELVIAADPELAARKESDAESSRRVTKWQLADGNVGVTAVLEALDAQFVDASLTDLAHLLQDAGVNGTIPELRAKALGILATPALALRLQQQALQPAFLTPEHNPITGTTSFTEQLGAPAALPSVNTDATSGAEYLSSTAPLPRLSTDGPVPAGPQGPEAGTLDHLFADAERWATPPTSHGAATIDSTHSGGPASAVNGGVDCLGHRCGTITVPPATLQPKVEVVVHVNAADLFVHAEGDRQGAAWIEHVGAITLSALTRMLDGKRVALRPVIDLNQFPAQDAYRPTPTLAQAVRYLFPREAFPWSARPSRATTDLDHTRAYQPARGPGQTRLGNLAPLSRTPHRAKTAGHWRAVQPEPGRLIWTSPLVIWTSPLGYRYEVTPHGTTALSEFADLDADVIGAHAA